MKNNMNETDVRVHNEIFKMYMADDQFERMSEAEEKKTERTLTEDEYYALKCKLY